MSEETKVTKGDGNHAPLREQIANLRAGLQWIREQYAGGEWWGTEAEVQARIDALMRESAMTDSPLRIKSTFALLDVETGRGALNRLMKKGLRVPVVIHGVIEDVHGSFDGTSQEFAVAVSRVEAGETP